MRGSEKLALIGDRGGWGGENRWQLVRSLHQPVALGHGLFRCMYIHTSPAFFPEPETWHGNGWRGGLIEKGMGWNVGVVEAD